MQLITLPFIPGNPSLNYLGKLQPRAVTLIHAA